MNRSTTSASVIGQPSSASPATSIRTAMRSVSTRTPSQSKITSAIGALTWWSRTRRPGSVLAAELSVIPGDRAGRREAKQDTLGGLLKNSGARLRRKVSARVAGHQLEAELANALGVALDRDVALEHRAAQLAVRVAACLELHGGTPVALEVPDFLRLAVRPGQQGGSVAHVPKRHQVRASARPHRPAREHALLVEKTHRSEERRVGKGGRSRGSPD